MPKGRGRDNDSDAATEDLGTVGTFETLRDEGEHFVHVKQWEKAIESFTKALEMKTGDKTCLVVRAKCFLMLGDSEKALADSDAALEQSEDGKADIRALCMKAEALYQKGDFETALVYYHRGNKLRSELQEFRLGIQKCQEAINNSIGSPSAVQLEASGDLSYFYKQEEKSKQQKGYTKVGQPQRRDEKKERHRPKDGTNSKTTKELLGQLYQDKEYLEKLFDSLSSSTQTDEYVKGRACDGIEYLKGRSDFWLQQKPMYARKKERQRASKSAKGKVADPERYVLRRLEEIDAAFSAGNYNESLDKSKKTLKKVEEFSEDDLNNKKAFEASLHSCMGNAYFEMENYSQALSCHQMDLQIANDNKLDEAESRALDNVGRTHAKLGNFEEAVDIWSKKLPMSKSPLESTWLYHEIGRCYLELGEYQEAKDYGEKAIAAAKEADDPAWILHSYVLTAQSEVKCGELEAATDSFTQALELAEEQKDASGQTAIKRALEEVNALIVKGEQQGADGDDEETKGSDDEKKETTTTTTTTTTTKTAKGGNAKGQAKGAAAKDDKYEDETFEKESDDEKAKEDKKDSNDKLDDHKNKTSPSPNTPEKKKDEEPKEAEEENSTEAKKGHDSDSDEKKKGHDSDSDEKKKGHDSDSEEKKKGHDSDSEEKKKDEEDEPKEELAFVDTDLNRKGDDKNESKA